MVNIINSLITIKILKNLFFFLGPGYWDHLANDSRPQNSSNMWMPLKQFTEEERAAPTYRHLATVPRKDETHGGEDVAVFASGPGSSLIRGVFEQNYLAYVMSYAGCLGPAKDFDDSCEDHKDVGKEQSQEKPNLGKSSATILGASLITILATGTAALLRGHML